MSTSPANRNSTVSFANVTSLNFHSEFFSYSFRYRTRSTLFQQSSFLLQSETLTFLEKSFSYSILISKFVTNHFHKRKFFIKSKLYLIWSCDIGKQNNFFFIWMKRLIGKERGWIEILKNRLSRAFVFQSPLKLAISRTHLIKLRNTNSD